MEIKFSKKAQSNWAKIAGGWNVRKDGKKVAHGGISFTVDEGVELTLKSGDRLMVFPNQRVGKGQPSHRLSVNTKSEK